MHENELAREAVDAALKVHRVLGPGLLESVYEAAMGVELERRRFSIKRQLPIHVEYEGVDLGLGFRVDLPINDAVLIELKSVETMLPVFKKQTLTYLRLGGWRLGLLINFNTPLIRDGITRIVNGLDD